MELLEHLQIDACWLYGHSMGGSIAIEVAALIPQCINALAVSEPNFHAGGGAFSRVIAAEEEAEFVTCGYATLLGQEKTPWAGSLQSNASTGGVARCEKARWTVLNHLDGAV